MNFPCSSISHIHTITHSPGFLNSGLKRPGKASGRLNPYGLDRTAPRDKGGIGEPDRPHDGDEEERHLVFREFMLRVFD